MKTIRHIVVAAVIGFATVSIAQQRTTAPNILVFVVDDLGWGDVGYHKGNIPTPQLDRLAHEGLELQRFYVYPVCSPTRVAFLTGQMPRRFGVADVMGPRQNLPDGLTTLPGTLRAAGYQTSLIGKWHCGKLSTPQKNGFDHFYGFFGPQVDYFKHTNQRGDLDWQRDGKDVTEQGYSTFLFADEAIRQLEKRDPARPLFIEVAFNAPHFVLAAPAEYLAKHKTIYAAVVSALDDSIGRILAALDKHGLRDNTLVVFFSDNGADRREGGSNGPFHAGKGTVFEGGIHTPALMRWPGHLKAGSATLLPVAVQDLFPTLAGAANVPIKDAAKLDGKNLWEQLRTGRIDRTPFLVATADFAIFDGDWKLIETAEGRRSLYQLSKDISETTDLYAKSGVVAQRLAAKLTELKKDLPAVTTRPRPGPGGPGGQRRGPNSGETTR